MKDFKDRRKPIRTWLDQANQYHDIANVGEIARRYFAMNAFDGILTIIGVLMGNFTAGVENANVVITTGHTNPCEGAIVLIGKSANFAPAFRTGLLKAATILEK